MTKYWFHVVLLLSVGSLVMSEVVYPGPGLVEIPWRDATVLRHKRCWRNNIVPYMYVNHNGIPDSKYTSTPVMIVAYSRI